MRRSRVFGALSLSAALALSGVDVAGASTGDGRTATVELTSNPAPGAITDAALRLNANGYNTGGDAAGQMELDVDGVKHYSWDCTDAGSCSASWVLDPAEFPGTHAFQVVYRLNDGQTVTSKALTFQIHPTTNVVGIQVFPATSAPGKWTLLIYVWHRGKGVAGIPVRVTLTPAVGKASTRSATTLPDGSMTFDYPFTSNTKIAVAAGSADGWGTSTRAKTFKYTPSWTCALAHTTVKHGKPDSVSCKVPNLPTGTKVDVAYLVKTTWVTLAKGKSGSGKVALTFTPTVKGKTYVRVESKGAKVCEDSSAPAAKLKVT